MTAKRNCIKQYEVALNSQQCNIQKECATVVCVKSLQHAIPPFLTHPEVAWS